MSSWRALCALAAALPGTACVYYNAMWSAEHFAHQARSLEAHDRTAEASGYWSEAEVKAADLLGRQHGVGHSRNLFQLVRELTVFIKFQ